MKALTIIFVFVLASIAAHSQTLSIKNDTLVWQVTQLRDVAHESVSGYTAKFTTFGNNKILWEQHDNYNNEFIISNPGASWDDPNVAGVIVYNVTLGNKTGTVSISRSESGLMISTSILDNGKNCLPFDFIITSVNKKL